MNRPEHPPANPADKRYWLDDPGNVNKLVYALYIICALLFAADFFYEKHGHFSFEQWLGFYGWFGFLSYVGLIHVAKGLRRLVKRDEDYYDD